MRVHGLAFLGDVDDAGIGKRGGFGADGVHEVAPVIVTQGPRNFGGADGLVWVALGQQVSNCVCDN